MPKETMVDLILGPGPQVVARDRGLEIADGQRAQSFARLWQERRHLSVDGGLGLCDRQSDCHCARQPNQNPYPVRLHRHAGPAYFLISVVLGGDIKTQTPSSQIPSIRSGFVNRLSVNRRILPEKLPEALERKHKKHRTDRQ